MKRRRRDSDSVSATSTAAHEGNTAGQAGVGRASGDKIGNQIDRQHVQGSINNTFNYYNDPTTKPIDGSPDTISIAQRREIADHRKQYLELLDFPQSNTRYVSIKAALQKTCSWITSKTQYVNWQNDERLLTHRGFFWIKGKPGTGKSTMMKFLSEDEKKHASGKVIITFFFHARGTTLEKTILGLYRSLLFQILKKLPNLNHLLDSVVLSPGDTGTAEWDINLLKDLIRQCVQQLGAKSLVVLVDALDECSDDEVLDMVRYFEELGQLANDSNVRLRMCLSSRHYPHITIRYGHSLILEHQEEHQGDIKQFIDSELRIDNSQKASRIKSKILEKASGIFLWVFLVVPILNRAYARGRIHELEKALDRIPDKLESLFQDILSKDFAQEEDSRNREELEMCVQWVLYAQRPLTVVELYFAINFGTLDDFSARWDPDETDEDDIARFVLDCSRGFVEQTKGKYGTVQFIHESVREFFLQHAVCEDSDKHTSKHIARVHEHLMRSCYTYLIKAHAESSLPSIGNLPKAKSVEVVTMREIVLFDFPFAEYAVRYCLTHGDIAQGLGLSQAASLTGFVLEPWLSFSNLFETYDIRRYPANIDILYVVANECLPNLLRQCITLADTIDILAGRWGQPIVATVMSTKLTGKPECLETFLVPDDSAFRGDSICETNLRPSDDDRVQAMNILTNKSLWQDFIPQQSALAFAMSNQYTSLVKCLVATGKIDVNALALDKSTLMLSIEKRYMDVAEYLLRYGASYSESEANWLLAVFSLEGRIKPVLKLLADDVTIKWEPVSLAMALAAASAGGHNHVVEVLTAAGADVNHELHTFPPPLLTALIFGRETIVRKLLAIGANIDVRSALIAAMTEWEDGLAQSMLAIQIEWFCDALQRIKTRKTPTLVNALVSILFDAGADPSKALIGETSFDSIPSWLTADFQSSPLVVSAKEGYVDVTEKLLHNKDGLQKIDETTEEMSWLEAARAGRSDVISALIQKIKTEIYPGYNSRFQLILNEAAHIASDQGHWQTLRILLEAGASSYKIYSLFQSALTGLSGASLTYARDNCMVCSPETRYRCNGCKAHMAVKYYGCLQIVKMALSAGINPNSQIRLGPEVTTTPLSASRSPDGSPTEVTTLLLSYGADPEPWIYDYFTSDYVASLRAKVKTT